jgi:hypothetical protein
MKGRWKRVACWCPTCDRNYLAIGKKCKLCGVKNSPESGKIKNAEEIKKDLQADGESL